MLPVAQIVIASHDKTRFEVTCYSLSEVTDVYTSLFQKNIEHFVNASAMSYAELAEKIHSDRIEILVDTVGHGDGNKLPVLAYKPAPVQISGIGYANTTGLKTVDYFIADGLVDPPGLHDSLFTEKLLTLPSNFSYALREDVPVPQYAPCTKRNYFVFGTVCRYEDMNDDILKIWKQILDRVKNSAMLMRAPEFASNSTVDQIYDRMKKLGFNMDQILFRPATPNYMAEMTHLDVILDPYPKVGTNLTLDALYMGVPVVSLFSNRRSTRFGYSIMKNIGLEGTAIPIENAADYINRAVSLIADVPALDAIHKNLRAAVANSQNIRPKNFVANLENQFAQILEGKTGNEN